ncbi:hypothetical protein [Novosphingobium sp. KCTC 2891]|uniref:hypothetical protein n=1 Tax=Novosphingobium sp. KCTC 2891 TaxID=2989730 RepID=UPI00222170F2|nr:hypothetical protein [Novosphingobium sp. KCTC 2891]
MPSRRRFRLRRLTLPAPVTLARIAYYFAAGYKAARLGSVRSQLEQIFAKLGVGRQIELAAMSASLARNGKGQPA